MHKCTKLLLHAAVAVALVFVVSARETTWLPQYLFPPRPYIENPKYGQQGRVFAEDEESLVMALQVTARQLRAAERHHYAPFLYRPINGFEDIVTNFFRRQTPGTVSTGTTEKPVEDDEGKRLEEYYTLRELCTELCMKCMYHMTSLRLNKTFDFGAGVSNYFPKKMSDYFPPGYKFRRMRLD